MTAIEKTNDIPMIASAEQVVGEHIKLFKSETFGELRVIIRNNEPWFVAIDVCRALDVSSTATRRLDPDEKITLRLMQGESRRTSDTIIVNEPGLYSLVIGSRKREAKAFKRWVTHDVIPSIRKYGAYMTDNTLDRMIASPEFGIRLLTELKNEKEKRKLAEEECDRLYVTNNALTGEISTWDNREIIKSLINAYSGKVHQCRIALGWNDFYRELLRKYHMNVRKRKTKDYKGSYLSLIREEEISKALGVAVAMCERNDIDTGRLINSINNNNIAETA